MNRATRAATLIALVFTFLLGSDAWAGAREGSEASRVPGPDAVEQAGWAVTLYGGRLVDNSLRELFTSFPPTWADSYSAALGVAKEFARTGKHLRWELEGQVLKHFSRQDHWELTAALVVRWVTFPWDHYLDTTFAAGDGFSYATDVPSIEAETHNTATRLLNYLLFEFTFSIPEHPEWALVTRIHHRSGVFRTFDGVRGASNVLEAGLRYSF